jgi:outer membrane protein TolC
MFRNFVKPAALVLGIGLLSGISQRVQANDQASGGAAAPQSVDVASPTGQAATKETPLTLEGAVRIALETNPSIRIVREDVTAAKAATGETRAAYYPDLGLVAGYSRWERHAFLPSGLALPGISKTIGPTDDWFAGLRASYMIFDSGRRRAELQAAIARVGVAEEEAARARHDIVLLVHQSYFSLAAAQEVESIARKKLARADDHLRLAVERKEAGAVPPADVVRAQVDVADAGLSLEKAASDIRIAKGNLNASMGLSPDMPIEIDTRPRDIVAPETIRISEALEMAVQGRPEIKAARQAIVAARNRVDSARSAFGLKIRAEGSYGWRDEIFAPRDRDWMAGISLELPLFTGFESKYKVEKARAELAREEAGLEALTLAVRRDVWTAYSNLKESYERIQAAEPLVRDAEESVRLARERYDAGAGTMTDLLDSEAALARAEGVRTEARWSYQIARSAFLRASGTLTIP